MGKDTDEKKTVDEVSTEVERILRMLAEQYGRAMRLGDALRIEEQKPQEERDRPDGE